MKIIHFFFCTLFFCSSAPAALQVVAAEGMYGELAKTLGGEHVQVKSILNNPNQDPHLFSAVPSTAKAVANAQIVIYNGLGYDAWMQKLTSISKKPIIIIVGDLAGKKMGDNPHLWYDPAVMPLVARALVNEFKRQDPVHKTDYEKNLKDFDTDYRKLTQRIQKLKAKLAGVSVFATEPLFDYMAHALGLKIQVLNSAAPGPQQLKQIERSLIDRKVQIMIYNTQVNQPLTNRLRVIAETAGIPVVGMTETQPMGTSYRQWMEMQLDELEKAVSLHAVIASPALFAGRGNPF